MALPTLLLSERVWITSKLYAAIQLYFAHWLAIPELDIEYLYQAHLKEVIQLEDRFAFGLATMAFLAQLRNGHTGYTDSWIREQHGKPLGFYANYRDGTWIVKRSHLEHIQPGAELLRLNGQPFEEFFQVHKQYVAASSEREARTVFFYRTFLFPQVLTITLDQGNPITIDRQQLTPSPIAEAAGRWLTPTVAYISIPSFQPPNYQDRAVELVEQFAAAMALIVDVRGNGGGSSPHKLIRALMTKPYRWWTESTPLKLGLFQFFAEQAEQLRRLQPNGASQPLQNNDAQEVARVLAH